MCRLRNIVLERVTDRQTDKVIRMCRYASQATQKLGIYNKVIPKNGPLLNILSQTNTTKKWMLKMLPGCACGSSKRKAWQLDRENNVQMTWYSVVISKWCFAIHVYQDRAPLKVSFLLVYWSLQHIYHFPNIYVHILTMILNVYVLIMILNV